MSTDLYQYPCGCWAEYDHGKFIRSQKCAEHVFAWDRATQPLRYPAKESS